MRKILLITFSLLFFFTTNAQLKTGEFGIGGQLYDYAGAVLQTQDLGYIITGVKYFNPGSGYILGGTNGMYMIKMDSNGTMVWAKDYCGYAGHALALNTYHSLDQQRIIAVGDFSCSGAWVSVANCYDLYGNLIWSTQLGSNPNICSSAYAITNANNYKCVVVGGECTSGTISDVGVDTNGTLFSDGSGINAYRINANGNVEWFSTIIDGTNYYKYFYGNGVIQDRDGGFLITGGIGQVFEGLTNGLLIKIDSVGNVKWAKEFTGTDAIGSSISKTNDGGFVVTGITTSGSPGAVFIEKFDSLYNVQWEKCVANNSVFSSYSIIQTYDNGFALTGEVDSLSGLPNMFVLKLDSLGNFLWARRIGKGGEGGHSIIQARQLSDKGYISVGYTYHFGLDTSYGNNIYLVKLDSNGWSCNAQSVSCSLVNSTNVITNITLTQSFGYNQFSGYTEIQADSEYVVCKTYTGLNNITSKQENINIYPNPFTTETTIDMGKPGKYYIEVDDMFGRKIECIEYTGQEYKLSSKGLSPDLYIVRVFDEEHNYVGSSKVVVTN